MSDGVTFDTTRIELAFALVAQYTARSLEAEFRTTCKGIVERWYSITPPATGRSAKTTVAQFDSGAQLRGIQAVNRDLRGIFTPVPIKGTRAITHLFGARNPAVGKQPPYIVKTKERWPDVKAIYDTRTSRRGRGRLTRGQRQAYYVDEQKFDALRGTLFKRVGWLASSLNAAGALTGARIPAYARGRAAPNEARLDLSDVRLHFRFANLIAWAGDAAGGNLGRLFQEALELQANAMFRRIPHMMTAAAKRAGFKVAA